MEQTLPYSQWRNLAEASVRKLKYGICKATHWAGSSWWLWCYCASWVAAIRLLTALDLPQLNGRTPTEFVLGSTPDILAYAMFDWYQLLWYHKPEAQFPYKKKTMGQWIGTANSCMDLMAYSIVTQSRRVITRKSMWGVMEEELSTDAIKQQLTLLDEAITARIGNQIKDDKAAHETSYELDEIPEGLFDDEEEFIAEPIEPKLSAPKVDEYTSEAYDEYLTAEVVLPHRGELARAKVTMQKHDAMGRPIGKKAPDQPMLDTRMYEVEFPDGSTEAVTANVIAENLYYR